MRRRDLAAFGASAVLAVTGVLVMPWGAAADPSDPSGTVPDGGPTATAQPTPSEVPSPSATPTPSATPSATPSSKPDAGDGDVRRIDDAVFTWSINQQTNAQSHNPLTDNFLAAGAANPGRGGMVLASSKWRAAAGAVEIQKRDVKGAWKRATWAGLGTDARGNKIDMHSTFSGHRVRITEGTGIIDAARDDATVQWKGTFTVVYYGGNTVFTLTDPKITVRGGKGQLTATGGGWASDRFDPTVWQPVPDQVVPVAEVTGVDVTEDGFTVTPGYRGVKVSGPEPQDRTVKDWGSFPQEFVTFLEPMGASQFWYSTGLTTDWTKLPDPIAVGWAGAEPEDPDEGTPTPSREPKPSNRVVAPPPAVPNDPTSPTTTTPTANPVPVPVAGVPLPTVAPQPGGDVEPETVQVGQAVQVTAAGAVLDDAAQAASSITDFRAEESLAWSVGALLLLTSASLLLVPTLNRRP